MVAGTTNGRRGQKVARRGPTLSKFPKYPVKITKSMEMPFTRQGSRSAHTWRGGIAISTLGVDVPAAVSAHTAHDIFKNEAIHAHMVLQGNSKYY